MPRAKGVWTNNGAGACRCAFDAEDRRALCRPHAPLVRTSHGGRGARGVRVSAHLGHWGQASAEAYPPPPPRGCGIWALDPAFRRRRPCSPFGGVSGAAPRSPAEGPQMGGGGDAKIPASGRGRRCARPKGPLLMGQERPCPSGPEPSGGPVRGRGLTTDARRLGPGRHCPGAPLWPLGGARRGGDADGHR